MRLQVAFNPHPFSRITLWVALCCIYLTFISCHWLHTALHAFLDVRNAAEMRHFVQHRLGLSERQLKTVTWPEMAKRIVEVRGDPHPLLPALYSPALDPCTPLFTLLWDLGSIFQKMLSGGKEIGKVNRRFLTLVAVALNYSCLMVS